jgi:hypothetical protein
MFCSKRIRAKQNENISLKRDYSETKREYLAQNGLQRNKSGISRSKQVRAKQTENIPLKTIFSETNLNKN